MIVLIAEDLAVNRRLLRAQLESERHSVFDAGDGVEALAILESHHVDVVVSDVLMPGMDGFELCRRIRAHPRLHGTPFLIYTSAYDSPGDEQTARVVGADGYLLKPAPNAELLAALQRAITAPRAAPAPGTIPPEEFLVMRHYNAALVRKLEEKNAELAVKVAQLDEAGELNRQILRSARDGIAVFDRELRFQLFNPCMEEIMGLRAADVIGRTIQDVIPAPLRGDITSRLERALAGEVVLSGDLPKPPGVAPGWMSSKASPLRNIEGAIVGVIVILNDVTERRSAEIELDRERRLLRQLIDQIPDSIYVKDTASRFIIANEAVAELLGAGSPAELLGKTDAGFFAPELADTYRTDELRVLAGTPVYNQEEEVPQQDGGTRVLLTTKLPMRDNDGRIVSVLGIGRDITERKRDLEALQSVQAKYRHIFEQSADGWYQTTVDGRFNAANPALARILGFASPEELIAQRTDIAQQGYVSPERRTEFMRLMAEHGRVTDFQYEVRRKDGGLIWVSENARAVSDDDGQIVFYEGSLTDITARRRVEEALRRSEERLQTVVANLSEGLLISQLDGQLIHLNRAALDIHGFATLDEARRRIVDFVDLFVVTTLDRVPISMEDWPLSRLFREKRLHNCEVRIRRVDQAWERIVSYGGAVVRDTSGEELAFVTIVDITERKLAEQRIREQARLLDLASDSITESDLEDRIHYWNAGSVRLYGWRQDEVLGRSVHTTLQPDGSEFNRAKTSVLRTGEWSGELRHVHKEGRIVTVNSRWTLLRDEAGQPRSILAINTDITERKTLEAQFLRTQRLEAIGTLASGIAHDLNNILAPILMSAPILRWNLAPKETEKILSTIETSAQRGADLVRQLLTFGRGIEGQRGVMRLEPVLREVGRIAQQTFPKNINTVVELAPQMSLVVADPTQVHQVLMNLVVNARDAMPNGGTLTIGAQNEKIDESFVQMLPGASSGDYLVIRVADTGTGISPEIMDKIFDPFFTTKDPGKGTGLGLATVVGIVKAHGGFTNVRSEVGQGTVFFVYLPAATDHGGSVDAPAAVRPPMGHGELLLLVDDEESIRDVVRETLVRHGYEVVTASDGADAVAHYAQKGAKIRGVITDVDMPVMDGIAMIQVLKRLNPELRVLVSSGLAGSELLEARRQQLESLGVRQTIIKPYTADKILSAVHTLLHD